MRWRIRGADVVTALGEREALQRLELVTSVSGILDTALDDYEPAVTEMADACVPGFADLCVVEVVGPDGRIRTAAHRTAPGSGLEPSAEWVPVGRLVAPGRQAVLTFDGAEETGKVRGVRERLGAQSLIVAPITAGGAILGWFVAATGPQRRGFRPSARTRRGGAEQPAGDDHPTGTPAPPDGGIRPGAGPGPPPPAPSGHRGHQPGGRGEPGGGAAGGLRRSLPDPGSGRRRGSLVDGGRECGVGPDR